MEPGVVQWAQQLWFGLEGPWFEYLLGQGCFYPPKRPDWLWGLPSILF